MKKTIVLILVSLLAISAAVAQPAAEVTSVAAATAETVTIQSLNGSGKLTDVTVTYDPQRIAILDMASLDILDALGVAEGRIVGSASTSMDYLQKYVTDPAVANLGTIKTADMEAVMAAEPDVIFIGGRLAKSYDALSEIAPVIYLSTSTEKGVIQSVHDNATTIAKLFGVEDRVDAAMADVADRVAKINEVAAGQSAIVGLVTSGGLNLLGNDGRCSIIGKELGFTNVGVAEDASTSTHGNESSFELVLKQNPQWIFILDRDAAINTQGAKLAAEIMDNELVNKTQAVQNGHLVIMDHPAVWYTAEGGLTALQIMLSDIEKGVGLN